MMMEFGHFILVIVKLDCRAANDGDCNFEKPLAACGYSQGRDDDLDWEQVNSREKTSSDPWMPLGKDGDAGQMMKRNHAENK
ncbi:hypothetical protein AMECASPLE_017692 [Ameca splendens]|uniref:MAM domain-containing protein n=1 Tax=Ameca splendens TaxID=208324 RepID=A0ABV0Z0H5_9TELE